MDDIFSVQHTDFYANKTKLTLPSVSHFSKSFFKCIFSTVYEFGSFSALFRGITFIAN